MSSAAIRRRERADLSAGTPRRLRRRVAAAAGVLVGVAGLVLASGEVVGSVAYAAPVSSTTTATPATDTGSSSGTGSCTTQFDTSSPVVGVAPTANGQGYWEVDSAGQVAAFGDATCYGSMQGVTLAGPIVGMAAAPGGDGYWLVGADGGVFSFGSAQFYGSMGGTHLNQPVVGMAADPITGGYWLVASDGGIFAFDAAFHGSAVSRQLDGTYSAMASTAHGNGYWLAGQLAGPTPVMTPFGSATFHGVIGRPDKAVQRCMSSQITPSIIGYGTSVGNAEEQIVLTNTSSTECTMDGYPGVGMLEATDAYAPVATVDGSSYLFGNPGPAFLTVLPGKAVSFELGYTDNDAAHQPSTSRIAITVPDAVRPIYMADYVTAYQPEYQGGPYRILVNALHFGTAVPAP